MATYQITTPDGRKLRVTAPEGTSPDLILKFARDKVGAVQARTEGATPESDTSMLESFGRGALQGASFGFADEIYGAGAGAYGALTGGNFSDAYDAAVSEVRAANDEAAEANPWSYGVGQVAGGVALPGGAAVGGLRAAGNAARAGLAARSLQGAKIGAGYGAAYGAGTADPTDADTVQEALGARAVGAGLGAVTGAATGAVLPGVVDAGAAVGRAVAAPVRAIANPRRRGHALLAQSLARDLGRADDPGAVSQALQRAEVRLRSDRTSGALADDQSRLMDVGGQNTRDLMRAAANQQSPAGQKLHTFLDKRQASQWRRIEKGMDKWLTGSGNRSGAGYYDGIERAMELARKQSRPLFKAAYAKAVPMTEELAEVLQRPGARRLVELAEEAAANEGRQLGSMPQLEVLHRVKMEIDRQIGGLRRGMQDSKANWDIRTLSTLKQDLKDAIKVPEYHKALDTYGGWAAVKNSLEEGFEDGLKMPVEALRQKLGTLAGNEGHGFRVGVARAIMDKVRRGNVMRDRTENFFSSPDIQMRLEAVFPTRSGLRKFQRMLVREARMADTRKAVQGNSTTAKQLMQAGEAMQPVEAANAAANAAIGRVAPLVNWLGRQAVTVAGMPPSVANEVIEAGLTRTGLITSREFRNMVIRARREPQYRDQLVRQLITAGTAAQNTP